MTLPDVTALLIKPMNKNELPRDLSKEQAVFHSGILRA